MRAFVLLLKDLERPNELDPADEPNDTDGDALVDDGVVKPVPVVPTAGEPVAVDRPVEGFRLIDENDGDPMGDVVPNDDRLDVLAGADVVDVLIEGDVRGGVKPRLFVPTPLVPMVLPPGTHGLSEGARSIELDGEVGEAAWAGLPAWLVGGDWGVWVCLPDAAEAHASVTQPIPTALRTRRFISILLSRIPTGCLTGSGECGKRSKVAATFLASAFPGTIQQSFALPELSIRGPSL